MNECIHASMHFGPLRLYHLAVSGVISWVRGYLKAAMGAPIGGPHMFFYQGLMQNFFRRP